MTPVDHVMRPTLPWRENAHLTECGVKAENVTAITPDEFKKRIKEYGHQRTRMVTCWTCCDTAGRWCTWDEEPRRALGREIEWEAGSIHKRNRGSLLLDELLSIAELIEAHRDEFNNLVSQRQGRREWLAKKAAKADREGKEPS